MPRPDEDLDATFRAQHRSRLLLHHFPNQSHLISGGPISLLSSSSLLLSQATQLRSALSHQGVQSPLTPSCVLHVRAIHRCECLRFIPLDPASSNKVANAGKSGGGKGPNKRATSFPLRPSQVGVASTTQRIRSTVLPSLLTLLARPSRLCCRCTLPKLASSTRVWCRADISFCIRGAGGCIGGGGGSHWW